MNYISYFAEPVKAGYSVLRVDIVADSVLVASWVCGSPAPTETVRRHERKVTLA